VLDIPNRLLARAALQGFLSRDREEAVYANFRNLVLVMFGDQ